MANGREVYIHRPELQATTASASSTRSLLSVQSKIGERRSSPPLREVQILTQNRASTSGAKDADFGTLLASSRGQNS